MQISIIIPFFNMENYISEALDSALSQTLKDFEIICVDDGSTDKSYNIVKDYSQKDQRIKIIQIKRSNAGNARNIGIKKASGKYVFFLDADDIFYNDKVLELLYSTAEKEEVNICGGSLMEFSDKGIFPSTSELNKKLVFDVSKQMLFTDYQYDFGFTRFIYNREFLLQNNLLFPQYKRYQDPVFFTKAMFLAKDFFCINDIVYLCRVGHKSHSFDNETINHILMGMKEVILFAKECALYDLLNLTFERINEQYYYSLFINSLKNKNIYALNLLCEISLINDKKIDLIEEIFHMYFSKTQNDEIYDLQKEISYIKSSFSYRLGLFLTVIPRKIRKFLNSKKEKRYGNI